MNKIKLTMVVVALGVTPAMAQQQGDPALDVCQQLLSRANLEVIQNATQATMYSRQLEAVKAELAKVKEELGKKAGPEAGPKPAPTIPEEPKP